MKEADTILGVPYVFKDFEPIKTGVICDNMFGCEKEAKEAIAAYFKQRVPSASDEAIEYYCSRVLERLTAEIDNLILYGESGKIESDPDTQGIVSNGGGK